MTLFSYFPFSFSFLSLSALSPFHLPHHVQSSQTPVHFLRVLKNKPEGKKTLRTLYFYFFFCCCCYSSEVTASRGMAQESLQKTQNKLNFGDKNKVTRQLPDGLFLKSLFTRSNRKDQGFRFMSMYYCQDLMV